MKDRTASCGSAMGRQRLRPGLLQRGAEPGVTRRPYNLGGHIARMQLAKAIARFRWLSRDAAVRLCDTTPCIAAQATKSRAQV